MDGQNNYNGSDYPNDVVHQKLPFAPAEKRVTLGRTNSFEEKLTGRRITLGRLRVVRQVQSRAMWAASATRDKRDCPREEKRTVKNARLSIGGLGALSRCRRGPLKGTGRGGVHHRAAARFLKITDSMSAVSSSR
jgi:hypothetical protein